MQPAPVLSNEKLLTGTRATCLAHLYILLVRGIGNFVGECGGGCVTGGWVCCWLTCTTSSFL